MSVYSPFLAATTQVLISKLLLSVPELIAEIAPEGFEHSPPFLLSGQSPMKWRTTNTV
ncbi:hypothetical protein [Pedobacter sp. NJ-S-72]